MRRCDFTSTPRTEDLVRTGVPPEEAARRAREQFGSIEAMKDDCRRVRSLRNIRLVHAAAALVVGVRRRYEDGPWGDRGRANQEVAPSWRASRIWEVTSASHSPRSKGIGRSPVLSGGTNAGRSTTLANRVRPETRGSRRRAARIASFAESPSMIPRRRNTRTK